MSLSSDCGVTYAKAATAAEWEEMRAEITEIWLNRAKHVNNLIGILRQEYGFVAT
jgi:hypothetical protein